MPYQFTSQILDEALDRANELTDGTSDYETQALDSLNRFYRSLWKGGGEFEVPENIPWWWLRSPNPGVITLDPVIDSGTVSVTNNSTSATLSATQATSMAGRFFKIDGDQDVFKISAHTAGTDALTLDSPYTGDTNTAASYKLMKTIYTLASDLLSLVGPIRGYRDRETHIDHMSAQEMDSYWPLTDLQSGMPQNFSFLGETTIRFSHYGGKTSTEYIRLDYEYLIKPADLTDSASEEPVVPIEYRHILSDAVLFFLQRLKEDNQLKDTLAMVKAGIQSMARDQEYYMQSTGRDFAAIHYRQDDAFNRGVVRTESGLILPI